MCMCVCNIFAEINLPSYFSFLKNGQTVMRSIIDAFRTGMYGPTAEEDKKVSISTQTMPLVQNTNSSALCEPFATASDPGLGPGMKLFFSSLISLNFVFKI